MTVAINDHARIAPGPEGSPIIGNIPQLRAEKNLYDVWINLHREFGDIVRLEVAGTRLFVVRDPDTIQHILQLNNKNYIKGPRMDFLKPLVGEGLITSEGDYWRRQRRLIQPAFHRKQIAEMADIMVQRTEKMLASWEIRDAKKQSIDLSNAVMRLTLDIVSTTLFSTALTLEQIDTVAETLTPVLKEINRRSQEYIGLANKLPLPRNRRFARNIEKLDAIIYEIIADRRSSGEHGQDLLGMLMEAQDLDTNEIMDDQQLRDEVMTIFLAGHETTAVLLSWTTVLLSRHPGIRTKLEEEVDRVLQGRSPTAADFPNLPYTQQILEESMRLFPPAIAVGRSSLEEDNFMGYTIPAGSQIVVNIHGIHRHEGYWDNPEGFDPDRFSPEGRSTMHRFQYLPFSAGPRVCIGNNFALMEGVMILAMITQKYRMDLVAGSKIDAAMTLTLRPKYGVPITLNRRT